jgi:catalase (peroxidase I)
MMLPTDLALIEDPIFRSYVELYRRDEKRFFADFAKAFKKLTELGCRTLEPPPRPWYRSII